MAIYEYKAIDNSGSSRSGIVDADSPREARTKLRIDGVHVVQIDLIKAQLRVAAGEPRDRAVHQTQSDREAQSDERDGQCEQADHAHEVRCLALRVGEHHAEDQPREQVVDGVAAQGHEAEVALHQVEVV